MILFTFEQLFFIKNNNKSDNVAVMFFGIVSDINV
jgi:hypothetical protein